MLTAAVVGVLLIACVNVAGMLTARGAARRREVAIRTALGASRRRVLRQLLTEAILLFVLGGALGVALGSALLRLLVRVAPPTLSWLRDVSLDGPMVAVALGMAALTGVLFGVLPSWKGAGADVVEVVASGRKGAGRGGLSQRFRWALVVSQIAIATIVVVGGESVAHEPRPCAACRSRVPARQRADRTSAASADQIRGGCGAPTIL